MTSATSALYYLDPRAAHRFLSEGLGFELVMLLEDDQGGVAHSEMRLGEARILIGGEWNPQTKSPRSVEGRNTQNVQLTIDDDVDAHCERARAAGFEILAGPEDQFYGHRTYRARDPEGHVWMVGQIVRLVSREEAEAATGLKITGWIVEPPKG